MKIFKHIQKSRIYAVVTLIAFMMVQVFPVLEAHAYGTKVQAFASNTISGSVTTVKTTQVSPHESIIVELTKPSNEKLTFPIVSNAAGYGSLELNSFHTQVAGQYKLASYLPQYPSEVAYSNFEVFADVASSTLSEVTASRFTAEGTGNDMVDVTVTLRDQYNNPVKDHQVKLISSRSGDLIMQPGGNMTSELGQVLFQVASVEPGVATFTVMNLTTNEILENRVSILFQGNGPVGGDETLLKTKQQTTFFGASLLPASTTSSGSTSTSGSLSAAKIKISTVPTGEMKVGELFDIIVDVTTADGMPALDYKGTIVFTSDDTNAILPTEYTFTGAEQPGGRKIFAKAARFLTEGTKIIEVKDKVDPLLKDVITMKNSSTGGTTTGSITILSPQEGIITSKEVPVIGKATPLMPVKIFDNNAEIASSTADSQGNFQTTLTGLTEGTHVLTVKGYDAQGQISSVSTPVSIVLNTTQAWIKSMSYEPAQTSYTSGQSIKVVLDSETGLSEVFFVLNEVKYPLLEEVAIPGKYTGLVKLPEAAGNYNPQIQAKNKLGVSGSVPVTSPLVVTAPAFEMESVSFSLEGDATVKASWNAPVSLEGISAYRIYYSADPSSLNNYLAILPTEMQHSFINLAPNTTYYFKFVVMGSGDTVLEEGAVKALTTPDTLQIKNAIATGDIGKIVLTWEMASASQQIQTFKILYGVNSKQYVKEMTVKGMSASVEALALGKPHYFVIQGLGQDGRALLQSEEISATPLLGKPASQTTCVPGDVLNLRMMIKDKQKYLTWDKAINAEKYRIHAGTSVGTYNLPAVEVTGTEYKIPEFDTSVKEYYFAVTALCGDNGESKNYSNALKVQTGPLAFLLFTTAIIGGIYLRKKKRGYM